MNRWSGPMVAVCLAPTDLRPEIDDLTGAVTADPRRSDLSASDAAALEYGLRIAEAWDGWVLAVSVGPPEVEPVLREVAALGVEVVRIDAEAEGTDGSAGPGLRAQAGPGLRAQAGPGLRAQAGPRPRSGPELAGHPNQTAARLAQAVLSRGRPELVICGDRSGDAGTGAVPAFLAEALGLEQALGLVSIAVQPGRPGRLTVERRLDGGWRERLEVTGPAVLSVEAAGMRLRRAGLAAALDAPEPEVMTGGGPGGVAGAHEGHGVHVGPSRPYRPRTHPVAPPEGEAHERLLALTGALSNREPPRVVGPVDPAEAVDELLAYLDRYGLGPAGPKDRSGG